MWKDKLEKVREVGETYSLTCVNPGVSAEMINSWAARVEDALDIRPPQEFLDVLLYANGFEWNGFILYGVDQDSFPTPPPYTVYGLIEQNEICYENESQRRCLFLGEGCVSWYVYDIVLGWYMELDNPSGQEIKSFHSCAEMLEKLLDDCLT